MTLLTWDKDGAEIKRNFINKKVIKKCLDSITKLEKKGNNIPKSAINEIYNNKNYIRYIPKCHEAIADFSQFVTTFPTSVYIPNALYWLGEASYVSRNFKRALDEFTKVVSQYPAHSKAKDAMLKIGFIQYENKQWQQARETLGKVIASYPDTTVSSLAQKRLERMRQEKH